MRVPRRWIIVMAAMVVVALASAFAFAPAVRWRVAKEAARRNLEIQIGGVRPGFFAVELVDVRVRPGGVEGIDAHVDRVRVELSIGFRVHQIEVVGGAVVVRGSPEDLKAQIQRWRDAQPPRSGQPGAVTPLIGAGLRLDWPASNEEGVSVVASGLGFVRDADGTRLSVEEATVHAGPDSAALSGGELRIDPGGAIESARAGTLALSLEITGQGSRPVPANGPPVPVAAAPVKQPFAAGKPRRTGRVSSAAAGAPPANAFEPIVPLPDPHALRERAIRAAQLVASRLPEGAKVLVDGLMVKVKKDGLALSVGPGALQAMRGVDWVDVELSSHADAAGTRLSFRAQLPIQDGDATLTMEGGPVSLALLGVEEGTMGLTDVERATVAGKGRMTVSGSGDALTFDGDVRVRGLGLEQPRLAKDVLRGLDMGVVVRGLLDQQGVVRLDDLELGMGSLQVMASGVLEQAADHMSASFQFQVPTASCESLFESVPTALLPTLAGTRFSGTFGASGRFSFDTRRLDDLVLERAVADECRVTDVPPELARERFKTAFAHKTYLPDGTVSEETTGPGTPSWTPLGEISPFMQVAVLTTEDGGFPRHHGFNFGAIRSSIIANLKARRFVRGASTITMQLAKNLFLARDKTLSRKLEEVILTDYLEQVFTKDEMMELYLNVIEFGPNVYGIGAAARHYFGRTAASLNLAECLILAELLPSPVKLHWLKERGIPPSYQQNIYRLMDVAHKNGLITDEELEEGHSEAVAFERGTVPPSARPTPDGANPDDSPRWQETTN